MDKNKLRAVSQYQLYLLKQSTFSLLVVLLINLILGVIFKKFEIHGGSIDIVTFIFSIVFGFSLFNSAFKFSLFNGVSRRTFQIASVVAVLVISLVWSTLTGIVIMISDKIAQNTIIYSSLYSNGTIAMFLWLFSIILVLIVFSSFMAVLLSSLSKKAKTILLVVAIAIGPIVVLIDIYVNGFISNITSFLLLFLGINETGSNPYLSSLMLVLLSVVVISVNWLFLRKAEIN